MALKDNWIDKKNTTNGIDGDFVDANDINLIAEAVIELEEQQEETPEINITIDDQMSDTSKNPVQNKVVKKYVDDEIIPKYEVWQSGKVYKVGSAVFAFATIDGMVQTVGMICIKEHTSESVDSDIGSGYWDVQLFVSNASIKDALGNVIHETYVEKVDSYGLATIMYRNELDMSVVGGQITKEWKEIIVKIDGEDIGVLIPAYTSDLKNDKGYITSEDLKSEIEKIFPYGDEVGY